jgi:hypothetical protein
LQTQIEKDQALQDQFIQEGTVSDWDGKKIQKYLDRVVQFQGLLLVLMHITEGQPAQGSEITGLQHSNGVKEQ